MTKLKVIGKCPICGGDVIERKKAYSCANWLYTGCPFTIWKEFFGCEITEDIAKDLLTFGMSEDLDFHSRDQGFYFTSRLVVEDDGSIGFRD